MPNSSDESQQTDRTHIDPVFKQILVEISQKLNGRWSSFRAFGMERIWCKGARGQGGKGARGKGQGAKGQGSTNLILYTAPRKRGDMTTTLVHFSCTDKATCHLPPATCHLPPATCHLPPATCHLLPARNDDRRR